MLFRLLQRRYKWNFVNTFGNFELGVSLFVLFVHHMATSGVRAARHR